MKKIPSIPPLLHQDKFVTDFKEKAILNNFFATQCSIVSNNSELPVLSQEKHMNPYQQ